MIPAIQELFEKCCDSAADELLRDGELPFQVRFLTRDDELVFCAADMPDADHERDALVSVLRLMAVAHDAFAVAVSAEVWFTDTDCRNGLQPSESPSRREALLVGVMYRDGESGVFEVRSAREIIRDVSGKIVDLGAPGEPLTPTSCDESMGRLARILPPNRPSRRERRIARAVIDKLPRHPAQTSSAGGVTLH